MITARQREDYARDGFLVLERFATPEACDALIARAGELVRDFQPETVSVFTTREQVRTSDAYFLGSGDKVRCFFEEEALGPDGAPRRPRELAINKIGHALHDLDPLFARFSRDPRLAAVAAGLGLRRPLLLQSMYIFKQPFIGGEVGVHQDQTFLWTDPPSVTGLWFALHDATVGNGCLWALPGGHTRLPARRFCRAPEGGARFVEVPGGVEPSAEGMVPLEVPRGTLVVLHGLLPHRSDANRSAEPRHAYALHVIEAEARYRQDNWLQRGPDMPLRGF